MPPVRLYRLISDGGLSINRKRVVCWDHWIRSEMVWSVPSVTM
jgi:hypothetical protein